MAEKKHIVIRSIIKSRLTGTGDFLLLADCCEWKSMLKVDKDSLVVIRECCVELQIGEHRKGEHFVAGGDSTILLEMLHLALKSRSTTAI